MNSPQVSPSERGGVAVWRVGQPNSGRMSVNVQGCETAEN